MYTDTVTVFVDPMLSVHTVIPDADFIVYPNPAQEVLSVTANNIANGTYNMRFSNVLGQIVWQKDVGVNTSTLHEEIDVTGLPTGIYFLSVGNEVKRVQIGD